VATSVRLEYWAAGSPRRLSALRSLVCRLLFRTPGFYANCAGLHKRPFSICAPKANGHTTAAKLVLAGAGLLPNTKGHVRNGDLVEQPEDLT
jgi:hypothetical protein